MNSETRSDASDADTMPIANTARLDPAALEANRDPRLDQLRAENAGLRKQLARLRAASDELREDNEHLRGSAICWRKLYEAALQSLSELQTHA